MGKIIARVRRREDRAEAKRAFDASPFGRILAHDAANPAKTIKFRRWAPPSWGIGTAELRQPEEQTKNEVMKGLIDRYPFGRADKP